jgi:AcrR family transcriptional regulator
MAKRASGEREKEERRASILALADRLCREKSYEEIKMAELAAELGLAKGTLYLYFPSKESLFLALLSERLNAAWDRVLSHLSGESGIVTTESVARETAAALAADLALPRLLAIVHAVLEKNVPYEEAVAYKRRLAEFIEKAGTELSLRLPELSLDASRRFFLYLYAEIAGLVQLTDISHFMVKIGAEPGLGLFSLHFEDSLRDAARILLAGLIPSL